MLPCFALAAPPALTTQVPREARPKEPVRIVIDTDRRTLGVYSGNTLYRTFPVAVGKPSTPTPLGNWQIAEKAVWGGAFGTRWLRLSVPYGIYGVHGTNNPGSIGSFASHGCVRMFNRDVELVYVWVQEGTPVDIVGTPPRRVIVEGSRGSEVSDVQRALAALGLYKGPLSGVFTAQLTQAVTEFQKIHNLRADGIVRRDTYTALGLYPPRRMDPPWLEQASPRTPEEPGASAQSLSRRRQAISQTTMAHGRPDCQRTSTSTPNASLRRPPFSTSAFGPAARALPSLISSACVKIGRISSTWCVT